MRRILRTLLHGFGTREVYEAEDGAAGLEAFTHYSPDIVITDWAMPIFDGLELTCQNLEGLFNVLPNVVWTDRGPCAVDGFEEIRDRPRDAARVAPSRCTASTSSHG